MGKPTKLHRMPRLWLGLGLSCLTACGGSSESEGRLNGSVNICSSSNPSQDYPQSANIRCLYRLDTGSLEFQAANSTRTVEFQGDTLYTLSTYVQQWDVATGKRRYRRMRKSNIQVLTMTRGCTLARNMAMLALAMGASVYRYYRQRPSV